MPTASFEGDLVSPPQSSANFGLFDYFERDYRPTFALNLKGPSAELDFSIAYGNAAFRKISHEFADFSRSTTTAETTAFLYWARDSHSDDTFEYFNFTWSAVTIHAEWSIISGVRNVSKRWEPHQQRSQDVPGLKTTNGNDYKRLLNSGSRTVQFLNSPQAQEYDICELVRKVDWASTPLGPITDWPQPIDQVVPLMIANPAPRCILWGSDRNMVYNDSYASILQQLHPSAMGASAINIFGTTWDVFEALSQKIERTKLAVKHDAVRVHLNRSGNIEEAFFNYTLLPLSDETGEVCGIFAEATEVTKEIVTQGQLNALIKIGTGTAFKTTLEGFWKGMFEELRYCTTELPFMLVYTLAETILTHSAAEDRMSTGSEIEEWHLRGSAGFPEGHFVTQKTLDFSLESGLGPALKLASPNTGQKLFGPDTPGLSGRCFTDCQDTGTGTTFSQFSVYPLSLSSEKIVGYLVFGISDSRPYDDNYLQFINLFSRQIEDAATSVVLLQKEKQNLQRSVQQVEYQRKWLAEQLVQQTKEARQSELRFHNFAEQAPVGVYIIGPEGEIKYCNEAFSDLIGLPDDKAGKLLWRDHVHPDDLEAVDQQWQLLSQGETQSAFEWRAVRKARQAEKGDDVVFLRSSAFPELAEDGSLDSVTGILMDVTVQRAHEIAIADRLSSALDAKRAQENFMDMVSHEMRNPLNAMLQCAEEAAQIITLGNNIAEATEAIDTILYCGRHQKQIIDDVLTISKLDSNLLKLYPDEATPVSVLEKVVKIFGSELRAATIKVTQKITDTCYIPIIMDPSRVLQVLINLVGNAIKFMKDSPNRELTLSVETFPSKPCTSDVEYTSSGRQRDQLTTSAGWEPGPPVYVQFSVMDTGPGLSPREMATLFARFKQASPRTHAQYGGSGLGLFISKELSEMHGGEIGLTSVVNKGSTFAFYIKGTSMATLPSDTMARAENNGKRGATDRPQKIPMKRYLSTSPKDITILIVEDNLVNQKVLQRQLNKLGYQTLTANQGQEALDIVRRSQWWRDNKVEDSQQISIILCDLEMPVMDGLACVRQIRQWQSGGELERYIPMVAVTGNARSEQVNTALAAGFNRVVSKPYSVPDIQPLVHELIRGT